MRPFLACSASLLLAGCATASPDRPPPGVRTSETISFETSEGSVLSFDVSPGDTSIVFDLLGQLWTLPAAGGSARAVTDAVRDTAEDLDPSVSPDGRRVVFRAERGGRTGLWLLDLVSRGVRQLTQVANPEEYQGQASWSPDGGTIAFTHVARDSDGSWHSRIRLLDVASRSVRTLAIDTSFDLGIRDAAWTPDGRQIAFVAERPGGGRIWIVGASGGVATPLSQDSMPAIAPNFSPDGKRVAFLARDSANRLQVWEQDLAGIRASAPVRLTSHEDVASTRVRWTHDGNSLIYAADGKLRQIGARGGASVVIPFSARLTMTRTVHRLPHARLREPGDNLPARAFLGLALSPDGGTIAAIALGKLWIMPVRGRPRALLDAPFTARGLAWSPDGSEVAWSAGAFGEEDLYAANVRTGSTRRVTALPGRELLPAYSPDGRSIAFLHSKAEGGEDGTLRIIAARAPSPTSDTAETRSLGPATVPWTGNAHTAPQWSPASDALLMIGEPETGKPMTATLVRLTSGAKRDTITQFVDAPSFLRWAPSGTLTFARHDRLWRVAFDGRAVRGAPRALGAGGDAAIFASTARDGTVLYLSSDGLRVLSPAGTVRRLGWPITYAPPVAPPLLIRNVRIVDGTHPSATGPSDILIEHGRIARVAAGGSIASGARVIDAVGKFVMPGLADLHAHIYRPDLLQAALYFGVTTVRDQGSAIGPLVAYADGIAAGRTQGPRVTYGGFQFYSDWPFDDEQGRGLEPEADSQHVRRSVGLAAAFGAQHIKTRTFRRWDINARMIDEAHVRGMRATGHCAAPLPLIAAGMDAKEHIGMCSTRGSANPFALNDALIYDDEVQLFRAARVSVVPTISYYALSAPSETSRLLEADSEAAPFITRDDFGWYLNMKKSEREREARAMREARATTLKLARAGVTIGTGTDLWQLPTAVHLELEELVASGLTTREAIQAATSSAARIIGADDEVGTIEPGKLADLLILDADPLSDIRNTRRISAVVQGGRVVDRAAIRAAFDRSAQAGAPRRE